MKILAITQARLSSTRFPGKVLQSLGSESVLSLHLKRIKKSKLITDFVVAAAEEPQFEKIKNIALAGGFNYFCGDVNDVLDRFYQASKDIQPDYIVRLTSDCPLIDPEYIDDLIKKFLAADVDYASNCIKPTLPDGMDAEIFTFASLETAWKEASKKSEREHVTSYIRDCGKFKILSVEYSLNLGETRMTLDTPEDYLVLKEIVNSCGDNKPLADYVNFLKQNPEISQKNSQYQRNEGYQKSLKGDS